MVDDVYQGQRIPKGSVVIANIRFIPYPFYSVLFIPSWILRCMTMDQNIYRRPEVFYPERYIPTPNGYGEPYPASVFGFGRRYVLRPISQARSYLDLS